MELDLDTLTAVRILGKGATGTVFLVTDHHHHHSQPFFALKVVDKLSSSDANSEVERRAKWEVTVLSRLSHPFLPSLLGRLETPDLMAWAVPYCSGGDLNSLRYSQPDHVFSTSAIRFYIAEIVLTLAHLHHLSIVYRDLKPENVLVQRSGHLTLTDFDLSRYLSPTSPGKPPPLQPNIATLEKTSLPNRRHRRYLTRILFSTEDRKQQLKKTKSARVSPVSRRRTSMDEAASGSAAAWGGERSNSFVGTEEYVSPEVVRGDGHDFAVDWWALGILMYEMAYGKTPFRGRDRKETFQNVLVRQPEFVWKHGPDLTDVISRLLDKDPIQRLGSHGGAEEVKAHPFFHGVQWDLLTEVARPPHLPSIDDGECNGNGNGNGNGGIDIREYFEKQRRRPRTAAFGSPLTSTAVSLTEF